MVSSILDLLDAQNQLLTAQLAEANSLYGFLEDLIAAEKQLGLFPFLEPDEEVKAMLDSLERSLGSTL
jgi:outer membrane protein TolC